MRWRIPLIVALVSFVALSCDQQPVEPVPDQVAEAPALNFMNGPENPGNSPVYRFRDYGYGSVFDFDRGLRVRLYDTFNTVACGGDADYPIWDYQDVDGDRVRSISQVREVPVVVYPFPNTPGKEFCDFLAEDWLYKGTGYAHINDNNVFWWMGTGGNNSFSVRVNGTVEDPEGNLHQLNAMNKYVVKGMCCAPDIPLAEEDYEYLSVIETINIH
ncbi:MAG: hypothetical protein WBP10_18055 [Thermoanaerobaculia bacterium]